MLKKSIFKGIQAKLLMWFLLLSLVPLLIVSSLSYINSKASLKKEIFSGLQAINILKEHTIENYFFDREADLEVLSHSKDAKDAVKSLNAYVKSYGDSIKSQKYKNIYNKIDPYLQEFIKVHGYYDLFIIDADHGHVVYTARKESDLGENLEAGSLKNSGLASLWRKVVKQEEFAIEDFSFYGPSKEPACFVGIPVFDHNNKVAAVLALQLNVEEINSVMQNKTGMGNTGESYLIGKDKFMRSESRFEDNTLLVRKVDTFAVTEVFDGRKGEGIIKDYRGVSVLSSYIEYKFKGLHWAVISEIDEKEAFKPIASLRTWIVFIALISVVFICLFAFFVAKGITKPIKDLTNFAKEVSDGDLTVKIDVKSDDEIGLLAGSFKAMVEKLFLIVENILSSSDRLSSSAQELSSSAQEMNATTEEVASTVQEITKGTETTAKRVEETSNVMVQMAASVSQVAGGAGSAASASIQAKNTAANGGKASENAVQKMNSIYDLTNESTEVIKKLGERSNEISEIITVITDIADQTNLLALNAAIEAARAGEAGRGFAVVAEEVRKLAEGSAEAADKISNLIKGIQKETTRAVESMRTNSKEVDEGRIAIQAVGTALNEIIEGVDNTASMVEQISAASQQMAAGTSQVVKSVDDIASTSEETASATEEASASTEEMTASMEEMAASAQELSQMAIDLKDLVSKFKIDSK
jgi:methyl-accepting chemotaxis protein